MQTFKQAHRYTDNETKGDKDRQSREIEKKVRYGSESKTRQYPEKYILEKMCKNYKCNTNNFVIDDLPSVTTFLMR